MSDSQVTDGVDPDLEMTSTPSIRELVSKIRDGETSPIELAQEYLTRIAAANTLVNAYISCDPELALAAAREREKQRRRGETWGLLFGVPVGLKDNFDFVGLPTTCGSGAMRGRLPEQDSAVASALRNQGAVVLGKLHLHEWAIGATSANPHFGDARNPWDLARSPGGSSGGAGVAVAMDLAVAAIGSDTGGSVRIPAALCGVSGLRPSFGRVSTRGLMPVSWSHDVPGPIARRAEDVGVMLEAISGFDPLDPTSSQTPEERFVGPDPGGIEGQRIGIVGGVFESAADPGIRALVRRACDVLADLGAKVSETELPVAQDANEWSRWVSHAEAAAVHRERLSADPESYGPDVLRRLRYGSQITGVEYALARDGARRWQQELSRTFETFDVLVTPTCAVIAPPLAGIDSVETTKLLTHFTYPFSLANVPAMSIPCGFSPEGLPVGLQLVAPWWQERTILDTARAYQEVTRWHLLRPPAR